MTLTRKGITTGRTAVAAIPATTVDSTRLLAVNVSNPDTKDQLVTLRINTGGSYNILKEDTLLKGVKATETMAFPGQPLDDETVTIDGKVYQFEDSLTDLDGRVKIGATAALSRTNLETAMDLSGTAGVDYADSMTAHPTCDSIANGADLDISAKDMGTYGNDIVIAEATTNVTVTSPLAGGVDKSHFEYDLPIGLALGDILEIVLGRAAATTELDWTCSYEKV